MSYHINYFADLVGDADLYRANPDRVTVPLDLLFTGFDRESPEIVLVNGIVSLGNPDNIYFTLAHLLRRANPIATLGGGDTFAFAHLSFGDMFTSFRTIKRDEISIYSQGADVGEPEERTDLVTPPVGFFSHPQTPPNIIGFEGKPHIIQTSRNTSSEGNSWARETLDTFLGENKEITVLERNPWRVLDETCIALRDGNLHIEGTSFGSGRYPGTFVVMKIQPGKYVKGNVAQMIPRYVGGFRARPHVIDFIWDTKEGLEVIQRWEPIEAEKYYQMLKEQRKMELVGEQV